MLQVHILQVWLENFCSLNLHLKFEESNTNTLHTKKHQPQGSALECLISSFGNTHYDTWPHKFPTAIHPTFFAAVI